MISIQMMRSFRIEVDEEIYDHLEHQSPKGVKLIRLLILRQGRSVDNEEIARFVRSGKDKKGRFNSIKTLVCRTRQMLNKMSPLLGDCIAVDDHSYCWVANPDIYVDALEAAKLMDQDVCTQQDYERLLELYQGPLIEKPEWQRIYREKMLMYVKWLNQQELYNRACEVCDQVLHVDPEVEEMQVLRQEAQAGCHPFRMNLEDPLAAGLNFSLDAVNNDLIRKWRGGYFCDMEIFRQIYQIGKQQMCFGIITVTNPNPITREGAVSGVWSILHKTLMSGDVATRYSPDIISVLLPEKHNGSIQETLMRIENMFYSAFPEDSFGFYAKVRDRNNRIISVNPRTQGGGKSASGGKALAT